MCACGLILAQRVRNAPKAVLKHSKQRQSAESGLLSWQIFSDHNACSCVGNNSLFACDNTSFPTWAALFLPGVPGEWRWALAGAANLSSRLQPKPMLASLDVYGHVVQLRSYRTSARRITRRKHFWLSSLFSGHSGLGMRPFVHIWHHRSKLRIKCA